MRPRFQIKSEDFMKLQLVVNNPISTPPAKRTNIAKNIPEHTIVRIAGFVGMLVKTHADLPYIADNFGAHYELFPSDELEILCTHRELAEYWLTREKPTPNYPVVLRAYDAKCRWTCGENCVHQFKWICPDCQKEVIANADEFGRFYSRNGACLDCRRADAKEQEEEQGTPETHQIQPTADADGGENAPSNIFDFFTSTTGN
jgi:hypothetical protein